MVYSRCSNGDRRCGCAELGRSETEREGRPTAPWDYRSVGVDGPTASRARVGACASETGHVGNSFHALFHVAPRGKVATCGPVRVRGPLPVRAEVKLRRSRSLLF